MVKMNESLGLKLNIIISSKSRRKKDKYGKQARRNGTFKAEIRAGRYDDIYRMDEIKSLSFHIMLYRLFRGVAKYIVYGNTFSSFG